MARCRHKFIHFTCFALNIFAYFCFRDLWVLERNAMQVRDEFRLIFEMNSLHCRYSSRIVGLWQEFPYFMISIAICNVAKFFMNSLTTPIIKITTCCKGKGSIVSLADNGNLLVCHFMNKWKFHGRNYINFINSNYQKLDRSKDPLNTFLAHLVNFFVIIPWSSSDNIVWSYIKDVESKSLDTTYDIK